MNTVFTKADFTPVWVYCVGPIGGALLAAALFALLRVRTEQATELADGSEGDAIFPSAPYSFSTEAISTRNVSARGGSSSAWGYGSVVDVALTPSRKEGYMI